MKEKEYALYKGDTFLAIGTAEELAKFLNVSKKTIYFYASNTYKKNKVKEYSNRYLAIKIEEENETD